MRKLVVIKTLNFPTESVQLNVLFKNKQTSVTYALGEGLEIKTPMNIVNVQFFNVKNKFMDHLPKTCSRKQKIPCFWLIL